jgi:hypothetical protein
MRKSTTTMKPTNDHKQWGDDDRLLLDMIARHIPKATMAMVLGRSERAITERIREHHTPAWISSGHPESAPVILPHAIGGMAQNAMERHQVLDAKLDRLTSMVEMLLRALGEERAEPEARPNGRAHQG